MSSFKTLNNIAGWLVFGIAAIVLGLAAEPTGSLWDCGEFIAGAYKLQVVHPPGAPVFLIVGRLFTWVEGIFRENEMLPPDDRINVKLDLENIIIEGSRQLRELEQLKDEIPSLDMALKFTDRPLTNVNLSVDEWKVVKFVDPKNTMRQIASTNKLTEIDVRRIVYGLLQAGLVELARPAGVSTPPNPKMFPTPDKEEQKSLINKLIGRIRTM